VTKMKTAVYKLPLYDIIRYSKGTAARKLQ